MLDLDKIVVIGVSHENLSLLEREDFMRTRPKYIIEKLYKEKEINDTNERNIVVIVGRRILLGFWIK